ncbi:MAG: hypothetical protein LBC63_03065 [Holophagales bacterium]|nr:hypothetical protein [Holophagales bacterium]
MENANPIGGKTPADQLRGCQFAATAIMEFAAAFLQNEAVPNPPITRFRWSNITRRQEPKMKAEAHQNNRRRT